jgi:hypothetical protein
VLQPFGEAVSVDPTVFQELLEFVFGNSYRSPARAKTNMGKATLRTQEIDQGFGATEAMSRFSNG